jgi:pimeloyl-ACP methyl ester carboxylesterase
LQKAVTRLATILPEGHKIGHNDASRFIGTFDIYPPRTLVEIFHTSWRTYLYLWNMTFSTDISDLVGKVSVPTYILAGKKDILMPPWAVKSLIQKMKVNEAIFIDNVNHIMVIDIPEILARHIQKFISKIG